MLRFRLLRHLLVIFGALGVVIIIKNLLLLYALSSQPAALSEVRLQVLISTGFVLLFIAVAIVLVSRLISTRLHRLVSAPVAPVAPQFQRDRRPAPAPESTTAGQLQPVNRDGPTTYPERVIRVRRGDSLWKIARHHLGHGRLWRLVWQNNPKSKGRSDSRLDKRFVCRRARLWLLGFRSSTCPGSAPTHRTLQARAEHFSQQRRGLRGWVFAAAPPYA